MKILAWLLTFVILAVLPACSGQNGPGNTGRATNSRKNIREVEPASASFAPKAGQTIYVPVYSSVSISDSPHLFNLAINLSFRNSDQKSSVILKSVRYFDGDGKLVRDYTPKPLRVGPLASADFFVKESDKAGGQSASFVIEWISEEAVTDAIAESVMVGTANTQGVSFSCPGRVLTDLRRP